MFIRLYEGSDHCLNASPAAFILGDAIMSLCKGLCGGVVISVYEGLKVLLHIDAKTKLKSNISIKQFCKITHNAKFQRES